MFEKIFYSFNYIIHTFFGWFLSSTMEEKALAEKILTLLDDVDDWKAAKHDDLRHTQYWNGISHGDFILFFGHRHDNVMINDVELSGNLANRINAKAAIVKIHMSKKEQEKETEERRKAATELLNTIDKPSEPL